MKMMIMMMMIIIIIIIINYYYKESIWNLITVKFLVPSLSWLLKFPVSVNSITGSINWKVKQESY